MQIYEQRNCAIDLLMTDLILPGCSASNWPETSAPVLPVAVL